MIDDPNDVGGGADKSILMNTLRGFAHGVRRSSLDELNWRRDLTHYNTAATIPKEIAPRLYKERMRRQPRVQSMLINSIQGRVERFGAQAERTVGAEFSLTAMNGVIKENMYTPEVSSMSARMSNMSWADIQSREKELAQDLHQIKGVATNEARTMFGMRTASDPSHMGRPAAYQTIATAVEDRNKIAKEMAAIANQKAFRKTQGEDPASLENTAARLYSVANKSKMETDIRRDQAVNFSDPTTGETKSVKLGVPVLKELENQIQSIVKNFKDLETASVKEAEAIKADTAARMDIVQKLETGKDIGGGGRYGGMSEKGWGKVAGYGAALGMIGDTANLVGVDHRIKDRQNIAGMAGLANQKYDTYTAARGGDIASQLAMGYYPGAQRFGSQIKATSMGSEAASTVGWGTAKIAGGMAMEAAAAGTMAATFGGAAPLSMMLAGGGAGLIGSGVQDMVGGASSLGRGIKSGQNYIAGVSSDLEARKQINAIPAKQMQGLRDFYVGSGEVAQGMGSKANSFLDQMTSVAMTQQMAKAGISPEQMVKMSQLGVNTVGSQFNTDQIFRSREYEKAGLGSMEQNAQRSGVLAMAGANNPQAGLESVMAAAMTKGLDGSKTLSMMVENTAAMVSQGAGAAAGIDTTAVTAAALATQADPNTVNKEFATQRAMTAQQIAREAQTNISTTFSGMVNTSRIQQVTGLDGIGSLAAGRIDAQQWKALQSDPNASQKIKSMGMDIGNKDVGSFISQMIDIKQRQVAEGAGVANAVGGGLSDSLFQKLKGTNPLVQGTAEYKEAMNIVAGGGQYKTVEELQRAVQSGNADAASTIPLNNKLKGEDKPGDPKDFLKELDALRTGGFSQLSEAASSAATGLSEIGGALKVFTDLNENMKKNGEEKETEYTKSAGEAADNFKLGVSAFGVQVTRIETILNNVISKSGMYVPPVKDDKTVRTGVAH